MYRRADEAYADLVTKLAKHEFNDVTPELRSNILAFYSDRRALIATKDGANELRKIAPAIDKLKSAHTRRAVRR